MSESKFRMYPARLAKAIAMSLAVTFAAPAAKATEVVETSTNEAPKEGERKRKKKDQHPLLDDSNPQTEKVKASLPDLGDDAAAQADAAAKKARVDAAAAQIASTSVALAQQAANGQNVNIGEELTQRAANASLAAGVQAARASRLPFFENLTGNISYGNQSGVDFNLQTVGLIAGKDENHKFLGQIGAHNEGDRATANLGLIYRYLDPEAKLLYGTSVFYDHDFDAGAHRIGFGAEASSKHVRTFANYYTPLSDEWVDVKRNEDLVERAATGFDVGISYHPAKVPGLDLQLKGTWWRGERVDVFGSGQTVENPNVFSARIGYSPVPLFGVSVDLKYNLGQTLEQQLDKRNVAQMNDLVSRSTAPVEREHRIVTEQRDKWEPLAFAGPQIVLATVNEGETYSYMLTLQGGKPPFTFTLDGPDAALFTLVGQELRFSAKDLPVTMAAVQDNIYDVTVAVRGANGAMAHKAFRIEVIILDQDKDGLTDAKEKELGTDPTKPDTDGDGLDDKAEFDQGSDPLDPNDPTPKDTDGDGIDDKTEIDNGTDPTKKDTDGDGLDDKTETDNGTDPTKKDTDGDGIDDKTEIDDGTDPTKADTDGEGLTDGKEKEIGTDPKKPDTDGDGIDDKTEVDNGTNPLDPTDPAVNNNITAISVLMDGAPLGDSPIVGATLSANVECDGDGRCPAVTFQWQVEDAIGSRNYVDIADATASTYSVKSTDQRRRIRVQVTKP